MAYVTVAQAVTRSRRSWVNATVAKGEIRKSASAAPDANFDVFLSHAYEDAEVVTGIKGLIEDQGQTVYIDWIEDSEADRSQVTPATAGLLRRRMKNCRFLLYVSSSAATRSRWMPWELGYFDGMNAGHVGIVPVVAAPNSSFHGQEYLGLYPYFELIDMETIGPALARDIDERTAQLLKAAVRSGTL